MKSGKPVRALVYGYTGYENTGDELLLAALLNGLRRYATPATITVMSRDPQCTRQMHDVACPRHEPFGAGRKMTFRTRWQRFLALAGADLLILGPGGIFQDYDTRGVRNMFGVFRAAFFARCFGARIVGVGLGAGPLDKPWGRRFARWICKMSELLLVRDEDSIRLLAGLGVNIDKMKLSADLAFLERFEPKPDGAAGPRLLGVSVFNFHEYIHGDKERALEMRSAIAECLDVVAERGCRIAFISMQGTFGGHDEREANAVATMMKHKDNVTVEPYRNDPVDTLRLIGRCDWFLGMRLHSLIIAMMTSTPFAVISYHPKTESFIKMIEMDNLAVPAQDMTSQKLHGVLDRLLVQDEPAEKVNRKKDELVERAEEGLRRLDQFCRNLVT